jgi:hypothetical protein
MGLMGGGVLGGEVVLNYKSGQVSLFGYSGAQFGWSGGVSVSAYSGFVTGLNSSNSNYAGGFYGASAAGTFGGFAAISEDRTGPTSVVGGSIGAALTEFTGGLSYTKYTQPVQLGRGLAFTDLDMAFFATTQAVCK